MNLGFHIFWFHLLEVSFHALLLKLFGLFNFFVIILHHFLIGLGVNWRLPQWLLPAPLLNLYDHLRLLVFSNVLSDSLGWIELLPCPPESTPLIKHLKTLSLEYLDVNFLLKHQQSRLPLRQIDIAWIGFHNWSSESFDCFNKFFLLNDFPFEL